MVPSSTHKVSISGTAVNLQIPSGTAFACKSFDISNCRLSTDCDWSGLAVTPAISGAMDLAGHVLALNRLMAVPGATFSGAEGSAVRFAVEDGGHTGFGEGKYIDDIANLTLSGNVKIVLEKSATGNITSDIAKLGDTKYAELIQDGGKISLTGGKTSIGGYSSGAGGHGVWHMNGGEIAAGDGGEFRIGDFSRGDFVQTGGDVNIGNWISIGRESGGNGTYTMTGGTLKATKSNRPLWIGGADNSKGVWNIGGNAAAELSAVYLGGALGGDNAKTAEMNISGNAKVKVSGKFHAETSGNSTGSTTFKVTQSGGELTVGGDMNLPSFRGSGSFVQTGGKTTVASTVFLGCGNNKDTSKPSTGVLDVGGEFVAGSWGVSLGQHKGGTGTLYLREGATLTTPSIYRNASEDDTKGYAVLNGGTIKVSQDGDILSNLTDVKFGGGEVVFDTDGHNTAVSGCEISDVNWAGAIVKDGEGTLTVGSLPKTGRMEVRNGTLAVTEGSDNTSSATLAHRWSFNGNLKDAITGEEGTKHGDGSVTYENGVAKLPGGVHGTCYIDLGADRLPGDNVTIEMWLTLREVRTWVRALVIGGADGIVFNTRRNSSDGYACNFDSCGGVQKTGKVLAADTQYYVAIVFEADGSGGVVVRQYLKEAGADGFLWTNTYKKENWSVSQDVKPTEFWLGHSTDGNNNDAKADYDEVRVWNGALTAEQIAWNSVSDADARFGLLEIASGAALDIGGNTLRQPVVAGGGVVRNGNLVVTKAFDVTVGETMTLESGATLDITRAAIAVSNPESIPEDGFVVVSAPSGGIVAAEPRKLAGGLGGYTLFLSPTEARIGRRGLLISIR